MLEVTHQRAAPKAKSDVYDDCFQSLLVENYAVNYENHSRRLPVKQHTS